MILGILGTSQGCEDLQGESAKWRPRRADGVVPTVKTGRLEIEEELIFHSIQRQSGRSFLSALLFYSGLQLIG